MPFHKTDIPDLLIFEPKVFEDSRGYFFEAYNEQVFRNDGINLRFVQDNQSRSVHRTLRGLHLQVGRPQAKLVRVIEGEIWDVAVDVRRGSPTFGRWTAVRLSAENFLQCYVPVGFAHGFVVLSQTAQVEYKCSDFYCPEQEVGIAWNDPSLAISWPVDQPIVSDRDRLHPPLAQVMERLPRFGGA